MWSIKSLVDGKEQSRSFATPAEALNAVPVDYDPASTVITGPDGMPYTINGLRQLVLEGRVRNAKRA
jgi:hypothetical protein